MCRWHERKEAATHTLCMVKVMAPKSDVYWTQVTTLVRQERLHLKWLARRSDHTSCQPTVFNHMDRMIGPRKPDKTNTIRLEKEKANMQLSYSVLLFVHSSSTHSSTHPPTDLLATHSVYRDSWSVARFFQDSDVRWWERRHLGGWSLSYLT